MADRSIAAESQRIYVDAAVNFRAEGGRAATGFVRDLSMTGMFVATNTLYLTGTEIDFSIRAGEAVVEGSGRVVWQRAAPSKDNLPIGIGIAFDRLDPASRKLIRDLVGGEQEPSEDRVEALREAVSAGLDAGSEWRPVEGRAGAVSERPAVYRSEGEGQNPSRRALWIVLTLAAVVALGLFLQRNITQGDGSAVPVRGDTEVADEQAGQASTEAALADAAPAEAESLPPTDAAQTSTDDVAIAAPAPAAAEPDPEPEPAPEAVDSAVRAWAEAWTRQDVDAYLAAYVDGYAPAGQSGAAWRANRRQRISAPASIRVEIDALEVRVTEPGQARARFRQTYRSDAYQDVVVKTLTLRSGPGGWKIVSESSRPAS